MDSTDDSSSASQQPHLPPGFRFHPTDEELVVHYLKRKASANPLPVTIIAEVDLYKYDPWELPGKASFGEQEWYFFTPRDRKYPNGARPNRAATSGYWKATGTDKPILTSGGTQKVGVKKALVFYGGRPPKGIKTNWIMHEYRLVDSTTSSNAMKPPCFDNKKNSSRLDEWVLCRIYKKNSAQRPMDHDKDNSMEDMLASVPNSAIYNQANTKSQALRTNYSGLLENDANFIDGLIDDGITQFQHTSRTDQLNANLASTAGFDTKRALPTPTPYWSDTTAFAPSTKRFHVGDGSSSDISAQLQQQGQYQQHTLFDDGVFRSSYQLPAMNWNPQ